MNFVLCLNDGFLFFGFRLCKSVVNDPGRLLRGRANLCFCNALAVHLAKQKAHNAKYHGAGDHGNYDFYNVRHEIK